ncbi:MAG: S24 family peptidase [Campylobacteraceae bacterium]
MPDLQEVLYRIKDILSSEIGNRKVLDKDVANALNINQATFATLKNRNKLPLEEVLNFCAKRKISINWLLYNQVIESLDESTERFAKIRYFHDIYASAGGGAFNYDETSEYINIDEQIAKHLGGVKALEYIDAINVIGDSMEPTLNNGSIVFIDKREQNFAKGGIFVVSTPAGIFIKRLKLKSNGTVELISDNPSYFPEIVEANSVEIIGKAVGSLSSF